MISTRFDRTPQVNQELDVLDLLAKRLLHTPEQHLHMPSCEQCIIGILRQVASNEIGENIGFGEAIREAFPNLGKYHVSELFGSRSFASGTGITGTERTSSIEIAIESIHRWMEHGERDKPSSNFRKPFEEMISPLTGKKYMDNAESIDKDLSSIPSEMIKDVTSEVSKEAQKQEGVITRKRIVPNA